MRQAPPATTEPQGISAAEGFFSLLSAIDEALIDRSQWPTVVATLKRVFPLKLEEVTNTFPSLEKIRALRYQLERVGLDLEEDKPLRFICYHLEKTALLKHEVDLARIRKDAALQALDHLGRGVMLVDEKAKVLMSNAVALEILHHRDGLNLHEGHLMASHNTHNALLRHAIGDVASQRKPLQAIAVPRPSLRHLLTLLIMPASFGAEFAGRESPEGLALIFLNDPDRKASVDPALFSRLYGLTGSEANLACRILEGNSLEEAAQALSISPGTARTHLKRIFLKTDTHRQSQLALFLMRSTAV